jgi:OPA family glycerol-3-phosphate transporter-like MFS transporter
VVVGPDDGADESLDACAATAVGLINGFVYLGSAVQSFSLGYLTEMDWRFWPAFMLPFAVLGLGRSGGPSRAARAVTDEGLRSSTGKTPGGRGAWLSGRGGG